MGFTVTLTDDTLEIVDDATAYQQEGPLTTFFRTAEGRGAIDCWAARVASFRTGDIRKIRAA